VLEVFCDVTGEDDNGETTVWKEAEKEDVRKASE
jgi:hypothetical protein